MILQSIKMAFTSIVSSKMRSFLTMLGIIIGVVSLIVLVSLVTSATSGVTSRIASMASDMLTVSISDDKDKPIKLADLAEIADDESIALYAPSAQARADVKVGTETTSVTLVGTTASYFDIQGSELGTGRLLKNADVENASDVVVLSDDTATQLYPNTDPVGQSFTASGRRFLVVGVLAADESITSSMGRTNYMAYIPFTTATRLTDGSSAITSFTVAAASDTQTDRAQAVIENALLERFKEDSDAFYVNNMSTLAETMSEVTNMFALLLGGIAAISLLVGGIGIMNIMLVSVTERTREIGIRKALGAKRASILLQFLSEALVVCLVGCAIGIVLSVAIVVIAGAFNTSMTIALSGSVIAVAVAFSTVIGLVFGIYPARKAAGMNPIDALRFE
jgi:putative ABC transport system permease protein